MPEEAAEAISTSSPKKKRKLIFLVLPLILIVILAAGGGAYFYFRSSAASGEKAKTSKSAKDKKKSSKAEAEEDSESAENGEQENADGDKKAKKGDKAADGDKPPASDSSLHAALPEDGEVKRVIELQPFIVNLADNEHVRYLRMTVSLGVGEGEGGESEKPDALFITRVRNAMLAVLSAKKSDEILTNEGKAKLRKELLDAAQAASEEPRTQAIYITDFIVQL